MCGCTNEEQLFLKSSTHILNYYKFRVGNIPDMWKIEYLKILMRNKDTNCCMHPVTKIYGWL